MHTILVLFTILFKWLCKDSVLQQYCLKNIGMYVGVLFVHCSNDLHCNLKMEIQPSVADPNALQI